MNKKKKSQLARIIPRLARLKKELERGNCQENRWAKFYANDVDLLLQAIDDMVIVLAAALDLRDRALARPGWDAKKSLRRRK